MPLNTSITYNSGNSNQPGDRNSAQNGGMMVPQSFAPNNGDIYIPQGYGMGTVRLPNESQINYSGQPGVVNAIYSPFQLVLSFTGDTGGTTFMIGDSEGSIATILGLTVVGLATTTLATGFWNIPDQDYGLLTLNKVLKSGGYGISRIHVEDGGGTLAFGFKTWALNLADESAIKSGKIKLQPLKTAGDNNTNIYHWAAASPRQMCPVDSNHGAALFVSDGDTSIITIDFLPWVI